MPLPESIRSDGNRTAAQHSILTKLHKRMLFWGEQSYLSPLYDFFFTYRWTELD